MSNLSENIKNDVENFTLEGCSFAYNSFVPRLYNWCQALGFEAGNIMPSRAFCSDESQGYPVLLLAKHFATFPFNHGRVGGIMALDRHGPHAHHGKDLMIVHASHVGYHPETGHFGTYRRWQTEQSNCSSNCGKVDGTLVWYLEQYQFAQDNILVEMGDDECRLTLDNKYLSHSVANSLRLNLDKMLEQGANGEITPLSTQSTSESASSTSSTFRANREFYDLMRDSFATTDGVVPIGKALLADFFMFQINPNDDLYQLEANLISVMPKIVTSDKPLLTAAQANTQAEFDRSYRSISQEAQYQGHNLLYVAGLNIDISPEEGQLFSATKFVPWAAYVQLKTGERYVLEQDALVELLQQQSEENSTQISLDDAMQTMQKAEQVDLNLS